MSCIRFSEDHTPSRHWWTSHIGEKKLVAAGAEYLSDCELPLFRSQRSEPALQMQVSWDSLQGKRHILCLWVQDHGHDQVNTLSPTTHPAN